MDDLLSTIQSANPSAPQVAAPAAAAPPVAAPQASGGFDPAKSYGTPAKLLDNLQSEESSGNPVAVNPKTGAMGPYQFTPSTVAALRQQGVKFDPFDPQQSRAAADYYMQQLKAQNGGTYEGALKAYGGFKNADPTQYINKAMSGVQTEQAAPQPTIPGQSNPGVQPQGYTGPTSDLFSTLQQGAKQVAPAPAAPQQPGNGMPTAPMHPVTAAQNGSTWSDIAEKGVGNLAQSVIGMAGAGARIVGANDFADQAQAARAQIEQKMQADTNNSVAGKVAGVVGGALPYAALGGATIPGAMAGGAVAGAIPAIADNESGAQVVRGAAGGAAAGLGGVLAGKAVGAVAPSVARMFGGSAGAEAAGAEGAGTAAAGTGMEARPVVGGGAASANLNPYPQLTGEEGSRGAFPQVKLSNIAQDLTPEEQAVRANIANQINPGAVRTGVVTGNENTLRDEYAAAKTPNQTPVTQAIRAQIANEQQGLANYAENRVNATGANQSIGTNEERGRIINDAIYGDENSLTSYLGDAKRQIYNQARATAGDNPITTQHVDNLFSDPQFQAGVQLRGNTGELSGAQNLINLARTTGFRDPVSGEMYAPGSVAAWDAVRKSLNSNWSPATAGTIREVNGAIDQDIAATGGQEMYKLGDRIHQVEQTLLDSKGISSVLGEYDRNGVKTGPSLESIPAKLNTMPMDQWQHIHDTLDDLSRGQVRGAPEGMPPVPPEVQQAAGQAVNEMHGALARSVYEAGASKAGVWNQNSVNKTLNSSVGQKIMNNFPPDEVQNFHTLNYGGQIMPGVHSYEGAGNQTARLAKPGFVERYAGPAATSAGAAIGGALPVPGAGFLGAAAGERAGRAVSGAMAKMREQTQLRGVTSELQKNSQLGAQPLNKLLKSAKGNP
jgi:hypothetical protein